MFVANESSDNMTRTLLLLCAIHCLLATSAHAKESSKTDEIVKANMNMKDDKHGIVMGESLFGCDDGTNDLDIDWNGSPLNYTCYHPNVPFSIRNDVDTVVQCYNVSTDYYPKHFCMRDPIVYNQTLPTHDDHRPLWPVFGEYLFVPPQRWLHNVEHGAIVMLYHPCTHPYMVNKLAKLVRNCIRKHVITRDSYRLTRERPLALVTWGCRMTMNQVNPNQVISFIQKHALKGPEGTYSKEGQYSVNLIRKATIPNGSTFEDSVLCPFSHLEV